MMAIERSEEVIITTGSATHNDVAVRRPHYHDRQGVAYGDETLWTHRPMVPAATLAGTTGYSEVTLRVILRNCFQNSWNSPN